MSATGAATGVSRCAAAESSAGAIAAEPSGCTAIRRGIRRINPPRTRSANPLASPATMTPSPTGTTTTSGSSGASSEAISKAVVFLPSMVKGL